MTGLPSLVERRDLVWPYCIGKAFGIAEHRVNPNARERSEPNRAKCPHEVRGVQNERRQCDSKTKRKHAEEDTRPQELICMLLCNLAGGGPPNLAVRPEQHAYEKGAAQDNAGDVPNIKVQDRQALCLPVTPVSDRRQSAPSPSASQDRVRQIWQPR